jgi:hypothetical protein
VIVEGAGARSGVTWSVSPRLGNALRLPGGVSATFAVRYGHGGVLAGRGTSWDRYEAGKRVGYRDVGLAAAAAYEVRRSDGADGPDASLRVSVQPEYVITGDARLFASYRYEERTSPVARVRHELGVGWTHTPPRSAARASSASAARRCSSRLESAVQALGEEDAEASISWWREWIDIGLARSFAHQWKGELEASEGILKSSEDPMRRHRTATERGRWLVILALVVLNRNGVTHSEEVEMLLRAALVEAEASESAYVAVAARFLLGAALLWHDDRGEAQPELTAEARTELEQALADCEAAGEAVVRVSCLASLGFLHRLGGDREATRAYAQRTLEAATALEMPQYAGAAHGQLAWLAWRAGDYATCEREGQAALRNWQSGYSHPLQWVARLPLMAVWLREGKLDEALACVVPLLEPGRQRLPVPLAEALAATVGGDAEPEARRAALERVLLAAQQTRRL